MDEKLSKLVLKLVAIDPNAIYRRNLDPQTSKWIEMVNKKILESSTFYFLLYEGFTAVLRDPRPKNVRTTALNSTYE